MNDLRKKLGIDDWLEIIKEDRVCNGAYISIAQYMYLLEQENQKYKEVIEKVKDYINDVSIHTDNYFDLNNNLWIREVELLDILKEVEHE